jgi:APA family basic amino acid/polyamine antiporter
VFWRPSIPGSPCPPAKLLLGVVVIVIVSLADIRGAIGFSSTGVLVYYAIANASAWTLPGRARHWRRPVAALGLIGCLVLVVTLPIVSVLAGLWVLALGLLARAVLSLRRSVKR